MKTTQLAILSAAIGIFVCSIPSTHAGQKGNPNPGILPPNAVFKGKTMGEWNAAWWYWVETTPGNAQMIDGILGDADLWANLDDLLPPGSGLPTDPTIQEGVDWAESTIPTMTDLSVRIDGKSVAGLEDGNLHYLNHLNDSLLSPLLNPDGSVLFPICYGYEISFILAPLAPGQHTIEMKGNGWGGFHTDVTYYLTVQSGAK